MDELVKVDVGLVMKIANVSEQEAIASLHKHNGDLVDSIQEFTRKNNP